MKKIIALVVAIVMMAAMAVPAFADISVNGTAVTNSTSTLLEYGVAQVYEVTIPAEVDLNEENPTANVALANGFCLPFGESLKIRVDNSKDAWKLTDTANSDNVISYTVKKGETNVAKNDIILEVAAVANSANAGTSVDLSFVFTKPSFAGTYQDTLTFTASLGAPTSANG